MQIQLTVGYLGLCGTGKIAVVISVCTRNHFCKYAVLDVHLPRFESES